MADILISDIENGRARRRRTLRAPTKRLSLPPLFLLARRHEIRSRRRESKVSLISNFSSSLFLSLPHTHTHTFQISWWRIQVAAAAEAVAATADATRSRGRRRCRSGDRRLSFPTKDVFDGRAKSRTLFRENRGSNGGNSRIHDHHNNEIAH